MNRGDILKTIVSLCLTMCILFLIVFPVFATDSWVSIGYQNSNSFVSGSRYGIAYGQKITDNIGIEAGFVNIMMMLIMEPDILQVFIQQ